MRLTLVTTLLFSLLLTANVQANEALEQLLAEYQKAADTEFSAAAGQAVWERTVVDEESGETRQCADCHTADLTASGQHINTGKTIEPLAPSANPKRLMEARQIKKWLLRNCKWTFGRECTAQEKGDVLTFINTQ
jgi:hypothetical protein